MISLEINFEDGTIIYAKRGIDNWDVRLRNADVESIGSHEDHDMKGVIEDSLKENWTHLRMFVEDNIIVVPQKDRIVGFDTFTGAYAETIGVIIEEIEAILILALCGDDVENADVYYRFAEKTIENWPSTVRPIP